MMKMRCLDSRIVLLRLVEREVNSGRHFLSRYDNFCELKWMGERLMFLLSRSDIQVCCRRVTVVIRANKASLVEVAPWSREKFTGSVATIAIQQI